MSPELRARITLKSLSTRPDSSFTASFASGIGLQFLNTISIELLIYYLEAIKRPVNLGM